MADQKQEPGGADAQPPRGMWEAIREVPLAAETMEFFEWMNSEGIRRRATGAIGPSAFFFFLTGWCESHGHSLSAYVKEQFAGGAEDAIAQAIRSLEPYQSSPSVSGFPYLTKASEDVLREAKQLVEVLLRREIQLHHLFAAFLLRAAETPNVDEFLGLSRGRVDVLRDSFLRHIKESGYGEAWAYWELAFGLRAVVSLTAPTAVQSSPPSTSEPTETVAAQLTGNHSEFRRNATDDELCLNIEAYAAAIADTFKGAAEENDFVFALYAPWGRGKSKLMEIVAAILGGDSERKEPGEGYRCITFSAWKYPTRPEIWVHLYQTIATAAQDNSALQKLRLSFRIGLLKHGWWPLWGGFGLLALSRLQLDLAHWLFDGLGIIGLLVVGSFVWNAGKLGKHMTRSHFSLPNHAEKLGLQAVIGEDLKHLLRVWLTSRPREDSKPDEATAVCDFTRGGARLSFGLVVALILATLGIVGWKVQHYARPKERRAPAAAAGTNAGPALASVRVELDLQWSGTNLVGSGALAARQSGGEPPEMATETVERRWQVWIMESLLGAVGLGVVIFAFVLAGKPKQHERVLLVVDDLDRCEPDQMLAVIESLRLFLDEPEMSRRMLIAMLLDRPILKQALLSRGKKNGSMKPGTTEAAFFREQEEKLFVASLELPALNQSNVEDIAKMVIDKEYLSMVREEIFALKRIAKEPAPIWKKQPPRRPNTFPQERVKLDPDPETRKADEPATEDEIRTWKRSTEEAKAKLAELEEELKRQSGVENQTQPPNPSFVERLTFTEVEREGLKAVLSGLDPTGLTPRAVRAFVVRYQLVRLLLRHLNQAVVPTEVIPALAAQLFSKPDPALPELPSQVRAAIEAVAGRND